MFYRGTIENVLSSCITACFGNCTVSDRKTLQWIVKTAEKITGVSLPSITDMYTTHCIHPTHPSHTLFTLLLSGKRLRSGLECRPVKFLHTKLAHPCLYEPCFVHWCTVMLKQAGAIPKLLPRSWEHEIVQNVLYQGDNFET
ncbi:hypothetical protein QTP70_009051 [Hemibagrus guttatus]|uniref:Uncharacterized protein n=1 Tax=Hemibagrus guttatus TaxID=175788 RepID=A0AAE0V3R1_9TELE|nr:hypothetical protein QTP70_009051 [Hemibagrus guttatus]